MTLEPTDIQQQLQDSLARLLAKAYSFDARQKIVATPLGHSPQVWSALAELGVLGAAIAEDCGGFGGDAVDQVLSAIALGRVLSLEPYHASVVMAATALGHWGTPAQQRQWLPAIAAGQLQVGWAHQEAGSDQTAMRARRAGGRWQLSGHKLFVLDAPNCAQFIVSARDEAGVTRLYLVDAQAAGLQVDACRLVDGAPAGGLRLDGVAAQALDGAGAETPATALQRVLDHGIAAACAEMVGAMQGAADLSFDYLQTRQQFGRAIGSNQALQHRAVDMLIALEQSRSLVLSLALVLAGRNDLAPAHGLFHAAKLMVGGHARRVAHEAIQLHGGIGMTEECAVGHYLRRVLVLEQLHGDSQHHQARLAQAD